ncbi:UNVERIFIED_CONTAM: hypothetical protein GTU68_051347 [Idotea baltica]|nr:hypothetical protein [Idotea baltica]
MNIILLKDLDNLGYADDVVNVKSGYARNFLIPSGKAVVANKANMVSLEERNAVKHAEEAKLAAKIKDVKDAIAKAKLAIPAKVGTSGKLFGRVTTLQLSDAIKVATTFEIDRRKIEIVDEISELGTYKAVAHLPQENNVEFEFDVVAE